MVKKFVDQTHASVVRNVFFFALKVEKINITIPSNEV